MKRAYIDTSAYLAILLGESEAEKVLKLLQGYELCASTFLLLEVERNLTRLAKQNVISIKTYELAKQKLLLDKELFILKDFTSDLCLNGIFPAISIPKSADLLHLRTAKWFQFKLGLDLFVTLDRPQAEAAREIGFEVLGVL